jgi:nucleoside-diphosphate-sugar epimerase
MKNNKMNILITGGAGFIGSCLGKFLVSLGYNVKLLDNLEYGYKDNYEDNKILSKNFILDDVRNPNFEKHLKNIDIVFHLAGISALPECESNPCKAFNVNTTAVANVLNACRHSNVKRVIFSSTSAIYENNKDSKCMSEKDCVSPNLIYSTTKYCAEQICRSYANNYGTDVAICRFFNVFGPHQDFKRQYPPFTSYLVREILSNRKPIIFNTTKVQRDYIFVEDLLEILFRMMNDKRHFNAEIFNLCSGHGHSTLEIAKNIFSILNKPMSYIKGNPLKF